MIETSAVTDGKRLFGRFTLIEKLGAGGQSEVWRARDADNEADVALKILRPELAGSSAAWAALQREYAIVDRLDYPLILKVYSPLRDEDFTVLPMDLMVGDLRRLRGAVYLDVVPVLLDSAQALEHAHEHGVIHRDLKSSNVLLDARGRVRVADFGAAAIAASVPAQSGSAALSPFTASPEQLRGEPPAISDDIYGLGALAYELLSGYPPYYPRFELRRALEEPVPELKSVKPLPSQLVALVMRMLEKRPEVRPQSMRDVIDELDAALNDTLIFEFDRSADSSGAVAATGSKPPTPVRAENAAAGSRTATRKVPAITMMPATRERSPAVPRKPVPEKSPEPTSLQPSGRSVPQRDPGSAHIAAAAAPARAAFAATTADHEKRVPVPGISSPGPAPIPTPAPIAVSVLPPTSAVAPVPSSTQAPAAAPFVIAPQPPTSSPDPVAQAVPAAERAPGPLLHAGYVTPPQQDLGSSSEVPLISSELRMDAFPRRMRLETIPPRRWPWVMLVGLAVITVAVFFVLPLVPLPSAVSIKVAPPRAAQETAAAANATAVAAPSATAEPSDRPTTPAAALSPAAEFAREARLRKARVAFEQQLAALESRGAGIWGGRDFGVAKSRAAEAVGAYDAGDPSLSEERLADAQQLLDSVQSRAPQALAAQLAVGERAVAAGQPDVAQQSFELAQRIDPRNQRAADGLHRLRSLNGVLALLADGGNAEKSRNYPRAMQDYSQALALDPANTRARDGLARTHAGFGDDSYAKAVGAGFAALGAGRLDEARAAFEKAHAARANGPEAAEGLTRVDAALRAREFAAARQRASAFEEEERWGDAQREYDSMLELDPALVFAQEGKERVTARAQLAARMQTLIDQPERMAAPAARSDALALVARAQSLSPSGPVLRSQIARLQILLPEYDKPVRLALLSDSETEVAIQRVGEFGSFSRREIELKPGKYTVVGTRKGFRDVRRDITIAPGGDTQTIIVSCLEPI